MKRKKTNIVTSKVGTKKYGKMQFKSAKLEAVSLPRVQPPVSTKQDVPNSKIYTTVTGAGKNCS